MNNIHTTIDGKKVFIHCMEDSHLINTINYICRNIKTSHALLIQSADSNDITSIYSGSYKLYSPKECKDRIADLVEKLQPYCLEACIRGLNITTVLSDTFGRNKLVALPEVVQTEEDDDDDDDYDYSCSTDYY